MNGRCNSLAHRAGYLRKKYKLTLHEASLCALWLAGVKESDLAELADKLTDIKAAKAEGK